MIQNVEFPSEAATLRGRLYLPDAKDTPPPAVVMAHGTSATITMVVDRYAEVFYDAGFAVLLYDHRNFGISDGEPRQEITPGFKPGGIEMPLLSCSRSRKSMHSVSESGVIASVAEKRWLLRLLTSALRQS